ncbi:TetR/AcrR family transcriptional regulator [Terriglobus roseus]|uniref:Transcriptional regulator, TetR family n=1 Tax=Terriglobus roseus TaxID=392734 RepID=A0A1H4PRI3_9BACT|nr:TetR/AcrR family transcriptional regulator [Terriglobus roseus]SEC09858.1 transcriptional regulator, TetR family [Terriglobus roseus]
MPRPTSPRAESAARTTFRHGDLRRALLDAGLDMARTGGPEAVILREATRRAGVVPNAAYRHFHNQAELLSAVRSASIAALAVAIEAELSAIRPGKDAASYARRSLRAVGKAYMDFALREPGLFHTAFSVPAPVFQQPPNPANAGQTGMNPFQLLSLALDRMVDAGILKAKDRPGAEFLAWSTVHGMSILMLDGPLRGIDAPTAQQFGKRLLDMVERGLG